MELKTAPWRLKYHKRWHLESRSILEERRICYHSGLRRTGFDPSLDKTELAVGEKRLSEWHQSPVVRVIAIEVILLRSVDLLPEKTLLYSRKTSALANANQSVFACGSIARQRLYQLTERYVGGQHQARLAGERCSGSVTADAVWVKNVPLDLRPSRQLFSRPVG